MSKYFVVFTTNGNNVYVGDTFHGIFGVHNGILNCEGEFPTEDELNRFRQVSDYGIYKYNILFMQKLAD